MSDLLNSLCSTPTRPKPRTDGVTCLMDTGTPLIPFVELFESFHEYIDFVKFGWTTGLLTRQIDAKISTLKRYDIPFWFGGTLGELAYMRGELNRCIGWVQERGASHFEISDGTISLDRKEKSRLIRELSKSFHVLSEVGHKTDDILTNQEWVQNMMADKEAGASRVIAEGRESGTVGLFTCDGALKLDLIEEILLSDLSKNDLIFEAPQKHQQSSLIRLLGADVNLSNIPSTDIVGLETLRLGLRSDTALSPRVQAERV